MTRRLLSCCLVILVLSTFSSTTDALAQNVTVTGKVTDAGTGEALPGANVLIKELNRGAASDVDGNYTILNVPPGTYTIESSFVGYQRFTRTVSISGDTFTLNVGFISERRNLDELVVVGYEIKTKRDITGATTQIRGDVIENIPVQSFDKALQGRVAGAQIVSNSGEPGSSVAFRIRGQGSISASNEPLYIIDGVQVNAADLNRNSYGSSNTLAGLNPADIESIEILKDAAAAAIYGAQAGNGVVLITTKRGRSGKTVFNVNTSIGTTTIINKPEITNGQEWTELWLESVGNRYGYESATYLGQVALYGDPSQAPTYDWLEAATRRGLSQNYELSAAGGDDKTRFYISGSYLNQDGHIIKSEYNRGTFKANLDHAATDRLSFETSLSTAVSAGNTITQATLFTNPYRSALQMPPINPIKNEDGTYNFNIRGSNLTNAIAAAELDDYESKFRQAIASAAITYRLNPNLIFRTHFGIDYNNFFGSEYQSPDSPNGAPLGEAIVRNAENVNWQNNTTLNFNYSILNKHNITGVTGAEYKHEFQTVSEVSAQGFPSGKFRSISSAAETTGSTGTFTEWKVAALFGRINYNYDERYYLSGTLRYDGSSRFGADNRYALFPSIGLTWNVSNEDFMEDLDVFSDLKLRTSYGVAGVVQGIGNFDSRGLFGGGAAYDGQSGIAPTSLPNTLLGWEESSTINVGIDFALFNSRFGGSIDAYQKKNDRLLLNRPIPSSSGFSTIRQNVGATENKGLELELFSRNIDGEFSWTTDFNIAFINNKVTQLLDDQPNLGTAYWVGHPLGVWYFTRWAGVNASDGRPMWYDKDGNITYVRSTADRVIVGDDQPDYYGGLSNVFSYRGFELDVFFQWQVGNEVYFGDSQFLAVSGSTGRNQLKTQMNRWRAPGELTDTPRAFQGNVDGGAGPSTRFLEDGSYIRLKRLAITYNVPRRLLSNLGLSSARVYAQGYNMWTHSAYSYWDPEFTIGASDAGIFPQSKSQSIGVQIGF